jgi:thioredoxin 1
MSIRVDTAGFQNEVLEAEGLVLADFYSDSCLPCKRLTAVLSKIEAAHPDLKVVKINIKYDKDLAAQYEVKSTPTILYFKGGQVASRQSGGITQADIAQKLEELL